jgi:hypothetical protein
MPNLNISFYMCMMRIKKFEAKKVIVFLKKFFSVSQNNALGQEASLPSLSSVSSLTTVFFTGFR